MHFDIVKLTNWKKSATALFLVVPIPAMAIVSLIRTVDRIYIFGDTIYAFGLVGIIICLILVIDFIVGKVHALAARESLLARLSFIFGTLSFFSNLLFLSLGFPDISNKLFGARIAFGFVDIGHPTNNSILLGHLSLPGLILAALAIFTGIIAYKRERGSMALRGMVFGVVAIMLFIASFATVGGAPFLCVKDNICTMVGYGSCVSYLPGTVLGSCAKATETTPNISWHPGDTWVP